MATRRKRDDCWPTRERNPHVPAYLSGRKRLPARIPEYIQFGDTTEAVSYAADAKRQWEDVPGAIAWLATLGSRVQILPCDRSAIAYGSRRLRDSSLPDQIT
jgi:hypothetical protein